MDTLIWAAAAAFVAIVAIFLLKEPLAAAIGRIIKAGLDGIVFSPPSQDRTPTPASPTRTADDLIRGIEDSELLRLIEQNLAPSLEGLPDGEKIRALMRFFASSLWGYMAMRTYHLIFGSQISALRFLSQRGLIPRNALRPFYEAAATRHQAFYQAYSYDQWLGFMQIHTLVLFEGDSVGITVRGQEFLLFLVRDGLSENKAG